MDKSGAWYSYQGDKIGQGKANASKFLEDNPDIANAIEQEIRNQMLSIKVPSSKDEEVLEEA